MIFLCVFLPACIAIGIQYRRNGNKSITDNAFIEGLRLGRWMFGLNLLSMSVIVFVLQIDGVLQETFYSFGFATKYMLISLFFAVSIPYLLEILKTYVSISFTVGEKDEEDK